VNTLPFLVIFLWLLVTVSAQSGVDLYFSRPYLPGTTKHRFWVLQVANAAAVLVTLLLFRLSLPMSDAFLIASRDQGSMAVAVLVMILAYFLWLAPVIGIRGYVVQEWLLRDAIREKKQAWWGYAAVGTLASALLLGALYIAVTIVPPLMLGVE